MRHTRHRPAALAFALLLAGVLPAGAQTVSSTIRGKVTDLDGNGLPGARVVVRESATGFSREVQSEADGTYRVALLRPGSYDVRAELPGYGRVVQKDVALALQTTQVVDLMLQPAMDEHIEVSAEPPQIDPAATGLSTRVDRETIDSTPLNGREFVDLAMLDSTVRPSAPGVFYGEQGAILTLNGAGGRSNAYLVDGSDNNDFVFGTRNNSYFSPQVIQEFQLVRDGYPAEFGRASGGVLNIITRSGTNELSGSAFYQASNPSMNRSSAFEEGTPGGGAGQDALERQQLGFTLAGPFVRNRAFYFAAYESGHEDNTPFYTGVGRDGVAGGRFVARRDSDRAFLRTDFHLGPAHRLAARLSYSDDLMTGVNVIGRNTPEFGSAIEEEDVQAAVSLQSVMSPTFFNEARVLLSTSDSLQTANSDRPGVEHPGGVFGGNDLNRRDQTERQLQLIDNVTLIRGRHSFKFGVDISRVEVDLATRFNPNGSFLYNTDVPFEAGDNHLGNHGNVPGQEGIGVPGVDDDGDGVVDEVADFSTYPLVYRLIEGAPSTSFGDTVLGTFVQDEWQVRDGLVLNLGLRYDVESFELGDEYAVESTIPNGGAGRDTDNIAPRASFTWLPVESGRLLVRGGFGIFYDKVVLGFPAVAAITSGQVIRLGFFQGLGLPIDENFLEANGVDYVKQALLADDRFTLHFTTGTELDTPYTAQWNIGFDAGLDEGLVLGLNYVHSRGYHVPLFRDINPVIGKDEFFGLPVHPDVRTGSIASIETVGNTWYDAWEVRLQRSRGDLRFLLSYTLSDSKDQGSDPLTGGVSLPPDSSNLEGERARSDNFQRHRLVASGTWRSPWWGLKFSPVVTFASGSPFNVTLGIDENLDGFTNERPDGLGRNTGARTPIAVVNEVREAWCNDAADEPTPCLAPFAGRLEEPDFLQVDLRVARDFGMGDSDIEGYLQVFNLFNHANRGLIDGRISSTNFGKPLAVVGPPRLVEAGVRFGF